MTHPNPDPVRERFDAYWLGGARDANETCYGYALAAYRAASTVDGLERAVVEAVMDQTDWDRDDVESGLYTERFRRILRARNALSAHRTPPKVDRVQAALDKLAKVCAYPGSPVVHARDLLTAELAARKTGGAG